MKQPKRETTRAAIYTRISDARDGDTAGVDRQREDCLALCAANGWTVVAVHEDNNVSAMRRKVRPAYAALLDDVQAGRCDVVVCWATDRLYRQPQDLQALVRALGDVQVATVKSGDVDLSTADGRLVARILGDMSAHESEKRGERVARAASQRAAAGKFGGGKRRFGYTATADALVPVEADALRVAYGEIAAGASLESIVRSWKAQGIVGPEGRKVGAVQIRDYLLRPMNAGLATYKGEEVGRTDLPTIVDEDTFRTVRAILMDPSRRTTRGRPPVSLLAPVLRCGVCDGRVGARSRQRRSNSKPTAGKDAVYACREGHVSRHRERLDDAVGRLLVAYMTEHAEALRRPVLPTTARAANDATTEAEQLRARLDSLSQLVAVGDLSPADYASAAREIRNRLEAVEHRIVQASGKPFAAAMVASGDVGAAWESATVDVRRAVVRELVARVVLSRGRPGPFTMDGVHVEPKE